MAAPPAFAGHREAVTELLQAGEPFDEVEAAIERTNLEEDAKSALWLLAFFLRDSKAQLGSAPTELAAED